MTIDMKYPHRKSSVYFYISNTPFTLTSGYLTWQQSRCGDTTSVICCAVLLSKKGDPQPYPCVCLCVCVHPRVCVCTTHLPSSVCKQPSTAEPRGVCLFIRLTVIPALTPVFVCTLFTFDLCAHLSPRRVIKM